jgi:hypothetical protein
MNTARDLTDDQLQEAIRERQKIQKRNPPHSLAWRLASEALQPLFADAARRWPVTPKVSA